MTIRTIAPLNDEDWDTLMKGLEEGQTEEQRKVMQEAHEHVKKLKVEEY